MREVRTIDGVVFIAALTAKLKSDLINNQCSKGKQAYLSRIAGESVPVCNESIKNQSKE